MPDVASIGYTVRTCDAADQPAILDLLGLTVGETEASRKTSEYWRWKHVANPFGASYIVAADDEPARQMAGLRALMRWLFRDTGGSVHRAVRPVDTATHPAHQRRGIFSALTRHAIEELRGEGVSFVFNTPNANSLPGYLKMGWQVVDRWPIYVRPVRPALALWRAASSNLRTGSATSGERPACAALMAWSEFRNAYRAELRELVSAHEGGRHQVGYRTVRDAAYLDWRYGAQPNVSYGVHVLTHGDRLEGIAIGRVGAGILGLRALILTEVFVRSPSVGSGVRLFKSLLRRTTCDYLIAHASDATLERRILRRTGFVPAPRRGYTFAARALNATPLDPARQESWDLTLGDLEIF